MKHEKAMFGAGCFWGVEAAFRKIDGVLSTTVGYSGGDLENPSYEDVCTGKTGHAEAVQIVFDPSRVSYNKLLKVFWGIHDPTTLNMQGLDIGSQYRSAVFYYNEKQRKEAIESRDMQTSRLKKKIVTEIPPASAFYKAEEYHQNYLAKTGLKAC